MISDISFTELKLSKKDHFKDHDQVYEDVAGFESLRKTFKNTFESIFRAVPKSPYSLVKNFKYFFESRTPDKNNIIFM